MLTVVEVVEAVVVLVLVLVLVLMHVRIELSAKVLGQLVLDPLDRIQTRRAVYFEGLLAHIARIAVDTLGIPLQKHSLRTLSPLKTAAKRPTLPLPN